MKKILIFLFATSSACNVNVNTVDPQVSKNISESKKNGFFIQEYHLINKSMGLNIQEVWSEYSWGNEANLMSKRKARKSGVQLVLRISDFSRAFEESKYLINWKFDVGSDGVVGRSSNIFFFYFNTESIPDTIRVSIKENINDQFIERDFFNVYSLE